MSEKSAKQVNSLELHLQLFEKYNCSQENPEIDEITDVLNVMASELLVAGYSPLLECAYAELRKRTKYVPQYFRANKPAMKKAVTATDAQIWLYLLSGYLKGNAENLANRIVNCQSQLFKNAQLDTPSPKVVDQTVRKIDERLIRRRAALLKASVEEQPQVDEDSQRNASPAPQASANSRGVSRKYLELHAQELEFFAEQFSLLRPALMEANEKMRVLEETVQQKNTEKAYRQLVELYELIADVKDSTHQIAWDKQNVDLENAAYNLEEFLYMISDALAEYGIDTVTTAADTPFNGKYHEAVGEKNFDPKTAIVAQSLRSGFIWGESVMKKERITLKSQEDKI